jgi:molybdopterin-guanine dinucleotide biosynthesis protein A
MLRAEEVTGLVLCGGASRRMGSDKALLELDSVALLDRATKLLASRCVEVRLAPGAQERYADRGLPMALDRGPDLGPLGGLEAGLLAARTRWVLAVACDLPWLSEAALDGLLSACAAQPGSHVYAWNCGRGPEPLCCLIDQACGPAITDALDRGERRALAYWKAEVAGSPARVLELTAPETVAGSLMNVNTPAEWDALMACTREGRAR